jgi:superfamily I DNA/RNA helicase
MGKFTDEQNEFLLAEGKNVVKACPGSGKTYMVANKFIKYLNSWNLYHQGVAVLSFTNVASKEILEKIEEIEGKVQGVIYPHFVGTVDSFINEFIVLRYGFLYTSDKKRPQIALTDNWKIPYKFWRPECHRNGCVDRIDAFHYGIDKKFYKGKDLVKCKLVGRQRELPCQQYKSMLNNKNIVFQNESALFAFQLLKKYPEIARGLAERFPIIIIDEAQDTSIDQMAVFDLLSIGGIKSFFLVGDPDQAIYEWRDATLECFLQKIKETEWNTIELTGNFRSSQNICNATCYFSNTLSNELPNNAIGIYGEETEKPMLLLTNGNSEQEIKEYFIDKCNEMNIEIEPKRIAILTRGRIHDDTDIAGLWKSKELEWFAQSRYEWEYGSRKKAISIASKAAFCIFYGKQIEEVEMQTIIDNTFSSSLWYEFIIDLVSDAPCIKTAMGEWVSLYEAHFSNLTFKYRIPIHADKQLCDVIKIKSRDTRVPHFKNIEVLRFFEKKQQNEYTRSSVHGVKGETYDAVLLFINSKTGNTLTPNFLEKGDLNSELMRIAYVAMTRPRRLLMVAMPANTKIKEYQRFPKDKWQYEYMK